jgi:hypothetical protein
MDLEFVVRAIAIGFGATAFLDLWSIVQRYAFGVPFANWALVGRWIGHFPRGRFVHESIADAEPVAGERAIGWLAHYVIGIGYAVLLLAIVGLDWTLRPTPLPAILLGIATVAAPFLVMQPGMGAGIAASKTPNPGAARIRALVSHTVFGIGLYVSAMLLAAFWTA